MTLPSIKKNYFYNGLLILSNIGFPLLVYPYVAQTLGPGGYGRVEFVYAVTEYFLLFGFFGFNLYGIREISKVRESKELLSKRFSELFIIKVGTTVISLVAFLGISFVVPAFRSDIMLFLIFAILVFLNLFRSDWFFKGLEQYKHIALRGVAVRVFALLILLFLVRTSEDYYGFALVLVIALGGTWFANFLLYPKFSRLSAKGLEPFQHVKPLLLSFSTTYLTKVYFGLEIVLLGFIVGDYSVGIYTLSARVVRLIIMVFSSFSIVLVPRMAYFHAKEDIQKFISYTNISLKIMLLLSIPAALFTFIFSNEIITIIGGSAFSESSQVLKIISPIIVAVCLSQIIGQQVLYASGSESKYFLSILIAAGVSLIVNIILIPRLHHNGAAFGLLTAEIIGMLFQLFFARSYIKMSLSLSEIKRVIYANTLALIVLLFCRYLFPIQQPFILIGFSFTVSAAAYLIMLWLMKEPLLDLKKIKMSLYSES